MTEIILKGKKGAFKDLMQFIVLGDLIQKLGFELSVTPPTYDQTLTIKPKKTEEISKEDFKIISDFITKSDS